MNRSSPESDAGASDLQPSILQKQIGIQWLEASFHCMEREERGSTAERQ
jgi:hypothetical protein